MKFFDCNKGFVLATSLTIVCFAACKKKAVDYVGPYAAKIGSTRLWSGVYSHKYFLDTAIVYQYIVDSPVTIHVLGNNIVVLGNTLNFNKKDDSAKTILFVYKADPLQETTEQLIYYYEKDSMAYNSDWSHHEFWTSLELHTN